MDSSTLTDSDVEDLFKSFKINNISPLNVVRVDDKDRSTIPMVKAKSVSIPKVTSKHGKKEKRKSSSIKRAAQDHYFYSSSTSSCKSDDMDSERLRTDDVKVREDVYFDHLNLSDLVLKGLIDCGYTRPSPIQLQAIPIARFGVDIIAQAKSGTGKTIVFSVTSIERVINDLGIGGPQVLIVTPTREIALQVVDVITQVAKYIDLNVGCFIGGIPIKEDRKKLLKSCHIAVGTPGRIKQLIDEGIMRTDLIKMFVLDEADKLFSEDFKPQIDGIVTSLQERIQIMAISATYPKDLYDLTSEYMIEPQYIMLNPEKPSLKGIKIFYKKIEDEKEKTMIKRKIDEVSEILSSVSFHQCIIFTNDVSVADKLSKKLKDDNWPSRSISGSLPQMARNEIMEEFRSFNIRILVSSDLISRGIDLDTVNLVINLDIPRDHETYLHRIGRTGRFGTYGIAINLCTVDELKFLRSCCDRYDCSLMLLPEEIPEEYYMFQLHAEKDRELLKKVEESKTKIIQKEIAYEPLSHPVLSERDFQINRQQSAIHLSNEMIYDLLYDAQSNPILNSRLDTNMISPNELQKRLTYFKKKLKISSIENIDKLLETEKWEHPSNTLVADRIRLWQREINE